MWNFVLLLIKAETEVTPKGVLLPRERSVTEVGLASMYLGVLGFAVPFDRKDPTLHPAERKAMDAYFVYPPPQKNNNNNKRKKTGLPY